MYAIGIVSVGCKKNYPYHSAQLYKATQAQRGHYYWKLAKRGIWRRGYGILLKDAEEMSEVHGDCQILNVRNGARVK